MASELSKKWRDFFMKVAYDASEMSKDTTKVGCVIVGEDKEVLSTGFNGFPSNVIELDERKTPEMKGFFMCHAERNAIDLAKSSLKGASLFCTHYPCHECTKSIIQKGIKTVYYRGEPNLERWGDSIRASKSMFAEAKIEVIQIDNADKYQNEKIVNELWEKHRDSFVPYTAKSSYVGDVISQTKSLPTPTSITSECGLPMEQSLLMAKPGVQIRWGSIGHLLGGMEPNDIKQIGTDSEKQPDLFETLPCSEKESPTS